MRRVLKYGLNMSQPTHILLPQDVKERTVLVGLDRYERECIWVEVDDRDELRDQTVRIFGTGHEIPYEENGDWIHLGSFSEDPYIWHVYWLMEN